MRFPTADHCSLVIVLAHNVLLRGASRNAALPIKGTEGLKNKQPLQLVKK
jgi:hypothetical protein